MYFTEHHYSDIKETLYVAEHKSGMKIYVLPKAGFTKSYAILATRYGSVNNHFTAPGDSEPTKIPDGIAHFLEHKMFDRKDGSNVFDKFSELGANANAFTGFTMTAYLFSASSCFYENLETLLDYTQNPYYTKETVDKEQGIIGQEIRMYEDDPSWNVYFNALRAMFKKNPVNIDIAGTVESISEITAETLYKCYNTFYHPSNMVLFCVGAVSPAKVGDYAERLIKATENPGEIVNHFPEEPKEVAKTSIKEFFDIGTPQFVIAYKDSDLPQNGTDIIKKDAEMSILLEIIGGRSSRLYNELYEKNLINDSFSSGYEGELNYAFSAFSGESSDPDSVFSAIKEEVSRLKNEGISPDSFKRAKRVIYGRAVSMFDRQESFANTFCQFAVKDADLMTYPQAADKAELSDIEKRLKLLDNDLAVLSAIYPKEVLSEGKEEIKE